MNSEKINKLLPIPTNKAGMLFAEHRLYKSNAFKGMEKKTFQNVSV